MVYLTDPRQRSARAHAAEMLLNPREAKTNRDAPILRAGLLLLLAVQREQSDAGHLDDLEANTRNVTNSVALAAEASDQDLVLRASESEKKRRGESTRTSARGCGGEM
jgi:hypothetical protein